MKTAMQEAIEEVENYFDPELCNSNNIIILLKSYLETEKQQIIDAYSEGMGHYGDTNNTSEADKYYNETFKN